MTYADQTTKLKIKSNFGNFGAFGTNMRQTFTESSKLWGGLLFLEPVVEIHHLMLKYINIETESDQKCDILGLQSKADYNQRRQAKLTYYY